jgi:hypothetical protein
MNYENLVFSLVIWILFGFIVLGFCVAARVTLVPWRTEKYVT